MPTRWKKFCIFLKNPNFFFLYGTLKKPWEQQENLVDAPLYVESLSLWNFSLVFWPFSPERGHK